MKIKLSLISDCIFGSGQSIPGGEDSGVQHDEHGFIYYKASSMKGLLKEMMENVLMWEGKSETQIKAEIERLFGTTGSNNADKEKIRFSDFTFPQQLKELVLAEYDEVNVQEILEAQTYLKTVTAIDETGTAKAGSLRVMRCIRKGFTLYGEILCEQEDEALVEETLQYIKYIGTMKYRGFGQVKFERV